MDCRFLLSRTQKIEPLLYKRNKQAFKYRPTVVKTIGEWVYGQGQALKFLDMALN